MSLEIKAKIDVTKILKEHLFQGKSGKYLDVACFKSDKGKSQYGDDGYVVQEISKEARDRGEKGPIIGNWRYHEQKPKAAAAAPKASTTTPDPEEDDVPF